MTDAISSGPTNPTPEHVIDPFAHYDEVDESAVFAVTVAGMSHVVTVAGMSQVAPKRCGDHDPMGSPS